MGADGGINWVYLKDEKFRQKFEELLHPLGLLWESTDKCYDDTHNEYIANNFTNKNLKNIVFSRYGTNQERQGMKELEEILNYLNYLEISPEEDPCWFGTKDPLALTWEDLILDYATSPNDYSSLLHSLIRDQFSYSLKDDKTISRDAPYYSDVLKITLKDWKKEVEDCIQPRSFNWAETWT